MHVIFNSFKYEVKYMFYKTENKYHFYMVYPKTDVWGLHSKNETEMYYLGESKFIVTTDDKIFRLREENLEAGWISTNSRGTILGFIKKYVEK